MFKVGDRVQIIAPESPGISWDRKGYMKKWVGHRFTMKQPMLNRNAVHISDKRAPNGYWSYSLDCIEKIREDKITEKIFHVGDICKDVDHSCSSSDSPNYLVKILEVADNGRRVVRFCNLNDESDTCAGHEESLVIVTPADKGPQPPVVTTSIYSDGVRVSEEEVEFDGKRWPRQELKDTVKRYQEVLRRPIVTAPAQEFKSVKRTTKARGNRKKA